jgi:hypothetical protein
VSIAYLPEDTEYSPKEKQASDIQSKLDQLNLSFEDQEVHPDFKRMQKLCKADSPENKLAAKRFAKMADSGTPSTAFEADLCATITVRPQETYTVIGPMGSDKAGPSAFSIGPSKSFIAKSSKGYLVALADWSEYVLVK